MKIKNSFKPKNNSLIRKLKPKARLCQEITVQSLSFSYDNCGTTFVKIYPSETIITSNNLIEMIETKKESIPTRNNTCVLRNDLFHAIQNYSHDESKIETISSDKTSRRQHQSDEPKRPTNAFILYRTALRKKIKTLFPSFSNSDVSKFTGAMWKAANNDIKQKYIKQAMECRMLHKKKYPNFEYNAKKDNFEERVENSSNESTDAIQWNSGINWCSQATTNELHNDCLKWFDFSKDDSIIPWDLLDITSGFLDVNNVSNVEQQDYQEWNEVCNIVSQFFPEDLNHSALIDDKLWASLANIDLQTDSGCELNSLFDNDSFRFPEHH